MLMQNVITAQRKLPTSKYCVRKAFAFTIQYDENSDASEDESEGIKSISSTADPSKEHNNLSEGEYNSEEEFEQKVYMINYESHEKDSDNSSIDEEYDNDDEVSSEDDYGEDSDAYERQ